MLRAEPSQDSLQMADDIDQVAEIDDEEIMINFPHANLNLSEVSTASLSPSVLNGRNDKNEEHIHNLRNQVTCSLQIFLVINISPSLLNITLFDSTMARAQQSHLLNCRTFLVFLHYSCSSFSSEALTNLAYSTRYN